MSDDGRGNAGDIERPARLAGELARSAAHREGQHARTAARAEGEDPRETVRFEPEDTRAGFGVAPSHLGLYVFIAVVAVLAVLWVLFYYPYRPLLVSGLGPTPINPQPFEPTNLQQHQRTPLPQDVRDWRNAAWQRDDIFAQLKLGDLYSDDQSFYDPVEAVVWYFLALRPGRDYNTGGDEQADDALDYLMDRASRNYRDILSSLTLDQREEARKRIIYILARRGPEGFITLGLLHRENGAGPFFNGRHDRDDGGSRWRLFGSGERHAERAPEAEVTESVLIPNETDALMYFYIAQKLGQPLADAFINSELNIVTHLPGGTLIPDKTRSRADNWLPAFEFYPGQTRGGILHTDESLISSQEAQYWGLIGQVPPGLIAKSLWIVGVAKPPPAVCGHRCLPVRLDCCELRDAVSKFQELIGRIPTGVLAPDEIVRLIRMAALDGDAEVQNELGIMYTKGIGIPPNFPRAQNWFELAAAQRYGEAMYNLAVLYKVGINGIPHDEDKAARLMADSAIAGFDPTRCQLLYLLSNRSEHPDPRGGP